MTAASFVPSWADSPPGRRATLAEALQLAAELSPAIAAARAAVAEAEAGLLEARVYPHNPEVSVGWARREGEGDSSRDTGLELSQQIEIAGQRGRRGAAATAEVEAARAGLAHERRLLAARVTSVFAEAARARGHLDVEASDIDLARRLQEIARRRFDAGRATELDLNFASAELGRARRRQLLAGAAFVEASAMLAEAIGLDPATPVEPVGEPLLEMEPPPLERLLELGIQNGADLEALRQQRGAAQKRIALARSEAIPDVLVGVFREREAQAETITGVGISLALPLFNRNQGAIAGSRAVVERVTQDLRLRELELAREIVAARARYEAAAASAREFETAVLGKLRDNLDLLERSFEAGKLGLTEVVVIRRELLDAQREHVEAKAEAWQARVALDLASGVITLPDQEEGR